jgi:hypothetical protein
VPAIQIVNAHLEGAGSTYVVQGWDDAGTSVSLNGKVLWALNGSKGQTHIPGPGPANPPGSGWNRTTVDSFFVGDVDGDQNDEIILINENDGWIGILKWNGTSLTYVNGSSPPVMGPGAANPPGSGWRIGTADHILIADPDNDGKMEVFLWNNNDLWVGLLNCATQPVSYFWGRKNDIPGPGGDWARSPGDSFTAGTYQGKSAIIVTGSYHNQPAHGSLIFENEALELVQLGGIPARLLNVTIPRQEQSNWCWVAVGSGISSYYDQVVYQQCYVVTIVFQAIHPPFNTDCCKVDASQPPCNGESGADQALDHPRHHFGGNTGPLSFDDVMTQIDQGRPFAAAINWSGGGSHFVAVTGYAFPDPGVPSVYVQDPVYGPSWQPAGLPSYQGSGTWVGTTLSQP